MQKTIIVTGANRGIGKEICRQLLEKNHKVILTARSIEKGQIAADELGATFMPVDVADRKSIEAFVKAFSKAYDHVDVLINNAAIFDDKNRKASNPDFDEMRRGLETNLIGPWQLSVLLLDQLKKSSNPRIINVSSGLGAMSEMGGGYPAYRLSKVGMNAMTRMIHSEIGDEVTINAMCPGWVKTDMGGPGASRSIAKGAETAVWLATADNTPKGKFLRDKEVIKW